MKGVIFALLFFIIFSFRPISTYAETYDELSKQYGVESIMDELPGNSKQILEGMGITEVDYTQLNEITFEDIINEVLLALPNGDEVEY